ncbi:uncharacterized protein ALTATR162_LOCUS11477 [Alternaria atra]|uniref:Uncharacterized protein n=1 Tax=Alternaria atra TaxID=119953 RepID=A0A8J2IFP8_9PLEO|nr:uncharacterized protein ALTATR162_LOCUS11477 [Alternaria atra]CAG5186048.1 unnamed protein product [Alternaria atra]
MPPKMIFGAGAKFHIFGIERPYNTLPAERPTSGAGAKMTLSKEVFQSGAGPEAGDGASAGSGDLAFATTKQVPTLKESELSRQVEQVSNNMSERGETASNQLEQALKQRDALQQQLNEEYDRAGNLELQCDKLKDQLAYCKNELANSQRIQNDTEYTLKQSESTLAEEQSTTKTLEARIAKLEKDVALNEAAVKDKAKQIDNLTADCQQVYQTLDIVARERDEVRIDLRNKELEFDDLKDQWQSDTERIAELEETIKEHEDSNLVAELENDIAGLNDKQEQFFRTLLVKDERISHLEAMLQKEKERNLHNADENARAAAASPVDDQRHIGSMGGTLEDEFSMLDEDDFMEYEPELGTLSAVHVAASVKPVAARVPPSTIKISQAASVEPRKAAPAPPSTIVVYNAASTEPAAVEVPKHAIAVRDAASVEPRDPAPAPPSTIYFNEPVSTAPEAARVPVQTMEFFKALSTSPIQPTRVRLSFHDVHDIASFAPEQPADAPLAYYTQKVASTAPVEPARPPLSFHDVHDIASYAPIQPVGVLLAIHERKAVSTEPIEPARASLSFDDVHNIASFAPEQPVGAPLAIHEQEAVSTKPVEPARAPLSINDVLYIASYAPKQPAGALLAVHEQEAVSTEPIEPARALLSINDVHDIASYAPIQPVGALLAIHEREAVSTEPIEPTRASLCFDDVHNIASFAPEQPTPVASTIVRHEIANFAPKEPSLPVLTVNMIEAASTRPVARQVTTAELPTQTDAPAATTNLSTQTDAPTTTTDLSMQTDPPALTSQLLPQANLETTPIEPSTQTATMKPNNRLAPIKVTREIIPVAEQCETSNTLPVMATSSKKAGFTGWIPMLFAVMIAIYALVLKAELAAWENANGVGFGGGHGNMASRSGAYGNGRYLFGAIPIGMDIGNSWVSEQIARHMSAAISLIEDWAGIANEPMY